MGIVFKEERATTTLDLIDRRIRSAVLRANRTPKTRDYGVNYEFKPQSQQATIDVDHGLTGGSHLGVIPRDIYYYRIRRGGRFEPVMTIKVMTGTGSYRLDVENQWRTPIADALYNDDTSTGGWFAADLDAPMEALEAYIVDELDK